MPTNMRNQEKAGRKHIRLSNLREWIFLLFQQVIKRLQALQIIKNLAKHQRIVKDGLTMIKLIRFLDLHNTDRRSNGMIQNDPEIRTQAKQRPKNSAKDKIEEELWEMRIQKKRACGVHPQSWGLGEATGAGSGGRPPWKSVKRSRRDCAGD